MDLRGHEARRFVEPRGQCPQRIRAEALSVLVLLRDRGQRRSGATTRVVLHEFCRERGGQRVDEAPRGSFKAAPRLSAGISGPRTRMQSPCRTLVTRVFQCRSFMPLPSLPCLSVNAALTMLTSPWLPHTSNALLVQTICWHLSSRGAIPAMWGQGLTERSLSYEFALNPYHVVRSRSAPPTSRAGASQ